MKEKMLLKEQKVKRFLEELFIIWLSSQKTAKFLDSILKQSAIFTGMIF